MNKKIISIFIGLSIFIFANQKDVTDGLLKKGLSNTIVVNQLVYPLDTICERKFVERFIFANENLQKRIKNNPEDLDFCRPLEKLYDLNKRILNLELINNERRKNFKIKEITRDLQRLIKKYPSSYYINFYAKLFSKNQNVSIKHINKELFEIDKTDYSDYMKKIYIGSDKEKKEEYLKYKKMDKRKIRYINVKSLVQSQFNLIYLNASNDVFEYLKEFEQDKLKEFVEYEMREHKRRGLELNKIYLDYAILILKENKRNFEESEKWVLNSYKEGILYEQTIELMRIRAVEMYFDLIENYPKYLGDREEVDYINQRLENIKIQELYLKKTSPELFYNKGFLNKKLSEIYYREKKRKTNLLEIALKNYRKALKYGNYEYEEKEKILDIIEDITKEIRKLKSKKREIEYD